MGRRSCSRSNGRCCRESAGEWPPVTIRRFALARLALAHHGFERTANRTKDTKARKGEKMADISQKSFFLKTAIPD